MVSLHQRGGQGGILNPTPVYEKCNIAPVRTCESCRADETTNGGEVPIWAPVAICQHFEHLPGDFRSVQHSQDFTPLAVTAGLQHRLAVLAQVETRLRVCQGVARDQLVDLT